MEFDGFFSLSVLNRISTAMTVIHHHELSDTIFLDFSMIEGWDPAALLWLIIGLKHFREQDFFVRLKLPDPSDMKFQRSANYLMRWNFDRALERVDRLDNILIDEQIGYFNKNLNYYRPSNRGGEEVLSNRLLQFCDLSQDNHEGIDSNKINYFIKAFSESQLDNIVNVKTSFTKEQEYRFVHNILSEGLKNTKDHPNASFGMAVASVLGRTNELILAIADNGESICSTILNAYNEYNNISLTPEWYNDAISFENIDNNIDTIRDVLDFATKEGITSKPDDHEGMGLFYLKQDTLNSFIKPGKLRILSSSIQIIYDSDNMKTPSVQKWYTSWKGNLLRVSIPLKSK